MLESLAKAGALDALGDRAGIVAGVDRILSLAQQEQRLRETGQTSMFDMFGSEVETPLPALELASDEVTRRELLAWERELLGTYISEHPFKEAAKALDEYVTVRAGELGDDLVGQEAAVAGMITGVRRLTTRQGKPFAAVTVEDLSGAVELTVWPESFALHGDLLVDGKVLLARVEVRDRGGRLTVAVQELAAYDQESRSLIDFDRSRFRPRRPRDGGGSVRDAGRPSASEAQSAPADGAANGNGNGAAAVEAGNGRARLHAVETPPSAAPSTSPAPHANGGPDGDALTGPRRLCMTMEETTDEGADRRRLARIVALLSAQPGELPVELVVRMRGGALQRLRLGGVAMSDDLLPRIQALLGVLGDAAEVGEPAAADAHAAAGAG